MSWTRSPPWGIGGTLTSWWSKIATGLLILAFLLLRAVGDR